MRFRSLLTNLGTWSASPYAFAVVAIYGASWLFFSPETMEWRPRHAHHLDHDTVYSAR